MNLIPFADTDVLCICGNPTSALAAPLLNWLEEKEERQLVIIDELHNVFDHPRIHLCQPGDEAMQVVSETFLFLSFGYLDIPGNSSVDSEMMKKHFERMAYFEKKMFLLASDFQDQGLTQLRNALRNRAFAKEARRGEDLFGVFKGIPALICGAGPSLELVSDILPSFKERALLFAGGTALSSLAMYGITPHFAGAIDPHSPQQRSALHKSHDLPLFYKQRVHPDVIKTWTGQRLW